MALKHILFVIPSHRTGGTISSLRSLLSCLDRSKYSISVYSLSRKSSSESCLPNSSYIESGFWVDCTRGEYKPTHLLRNFIVLVLRVWNHIFNGFLIKRVIFGIEAKRLSRMNFDDIIAYEENSDTLRLVSYTKALNRVAWIHCDYSRIYNNRCFNAFDRFNSIICVSDYTKKSFIRLFPQFSEKVDYVYNLLNVSKIISLSNDVVDEYSNDAINIVSIGRLDPVKQFTVIPKILSEIKQVIQRKIAWYIVGDNYVPGEREKIENEIIKYKLSGEIHLVGLKKNPYKYLSRADIVVSTSLSEACPYVINEAKITGTPIVCNNFGSAHEFVENYVTGIICDIDIMPLKIIELIENKDNCYNIIKNSLAKYNYPNKEILEKIELILQ